MSAIKNPIVNTHDEEMIIIFFNFLFNFSFSKRKLLKDIHTPIDNAAKIKYGLIEIQTDAKNAPIIKKTFFFVLLKVDFNKKYIDKIIKFVQNALICTIEPLINVKSNKNIEEDKIDI